MAENTQYTITDEPDQVSSFPEKRPCLIMIKGDFIGQVYELAKDVTIIGRSDDVDLVISDVSISRRHAMIVNRLAGFHVSDLGSTNGSLVNKTPVVEPTPLREGDKLSLGMVTFKFSFQDEDDTQYHLMLRNMAIKDGLTRIYNKRHFLDALEKEFDYNRRNHSGLALVMFDIDHFKEVNDTHGHPAGDFILKHMAQLIENEARGYDLFARYGGEEFVFMMRGATQDAALALAERVRSTIARHTFDYDDQHLSITVSLGMSFWDGGSSVQKPAELIEMADRRLYQAKNGGRNRVFFDDLPANPE